MDCQIIMKKVKFETTNKQQESVGEDRLSSLPDDLIHHILSFSDAKVAVQTSVLSKRWKLIWTTLPFLKFFGHWDIRFVENYLSHRNHDHDLVKLYLCIFCDPPLCLYCKFVSYAISCNVQDLDVAFVSYNAIKLSTFSSTSLKKLKLKLYFDDKLESDCCWDLPALTTLHLKPLIRKTLPESYLNCLSSLETLSLDNFNLPDSVGMLSLKTLSLRMCKLPAKAWDLPALLTLNLDDVEFPEEITSDFLRGLVNLQNLTLYFETSIENDWVINCPQLVSLEIRGHLNNITDTHFGKIFITSQKICNFSSCGFFPITTEVSELENVNVKLWDGIGYRTSKPKKSMKEYFFRVTDMFREFRNARILTLDLNTIKALSSILDFLVHSPPPFYHLKYVKVPHGYKVSSMSPYLKCYLLGNSPEATILTTLPQDMINHTAVAYVKHQNVVQQGPLAVPTKVLADCVHKTLDMEVQEEHVVQNSVVNADRVWEIGAPIDMTGNNQISSCRRYCDIGVWRGHEVNSRFVWLLDLIMNKHPETFEHFNTKNKKLCTMKLNMLCTSVDDFTKIYMAKVDTEMISEYRDVFADLQKLGFNVSWLVNHLNYVEHVRFSESPLPDQHIVNAKHEVQDLKTLCNEKMQEIQISFGTMATNLAVGQIGDDLLCDP